MFKGVGLFFIFPIIGPCGVMDLGYLRFDLHEPLILDLFFFISYTSTGFRDDFLLPIAQDVLHRPVLEFPVCLFFARMHETL